MNGRSNSDLKLAGNSNHAAMDAERALTQCRRDQLYLRWGEQNELFVPVRYAIKGVERALTHEHPELREVLLDLANEPFPHLFRRP